MRKIGIFDPDQNKYIDWYQCISCDNYYQDINEVWQCKTCKIDSCTLCKESIHSKCDNTKDTNTIYLSHPKDCDCNLCDDPYGFYVPTMDKYKL